MVRPTIRGVDRTVIHFTCPNCQASYHAPDDAAGRQATCRACKARLRVPSKAPPPVQAPPLSSTPVPVTAPEATPRRRSSRFTWPLVGAAICLFLGCAGGVTGTLYALRLPPSLPGINLPSLATGAVDAHDLCKEFRDDSIVASKKYAGKRITVSGVVIVVGQHDTYTAIYLRPNFRVKLKSRLDSPPEIGSSIVAVGMLDGDGGNASMDEASLIYSSK